MKAKKRIVITCLGILILMLAVYAGAYLNAKSVASATMIKPGYVHLYDYSLTGLSWTFINLPAKDVSVTAGHIVEVNFSGRVVSNNMPNLK